MSKKYLVLAALVLALMFPVLTQQVFTEENANYVYPTMEFDAVQLNATAYRFHNGDTLNLTFEFSTKGTATANLPTHFDFFHETNFTETYIAYMEEFHYNDGKETGYTYVALSAGVEGVTTRHHIAWGRSLDNSTLYFPSVGDHVVKYVILFTIEGAAEGFLDINFLSEVALTVVEFDLPSLTPPQLLAASAATGGVATAGIIGVAAFIKKRHSKPISGESIKSKSSPFFI